MIEGMLLTLDVLGMLLLIRWSLAQDSKLRGVISTEDARTRK